MAIDYTQLKDMAERDILISDDLRQILGTADQPFELAEQQLTTDLQNRVSYALAILAAMGQREPKAIGTTVSQVLRDTNGEAFMLCLKGDDGFQYLMDINEAPDAFRMFDDSKLINRRIVVVAYTYTLKNGSKELADDVPIIDQVNVFVSYKERQRYWEEKRDNLKIMKGKVRRVRPEGVEVASLGQKVIIPLDKFYGYPYEPFLVNRMIRFVVSDVVTVNGALKVIGDQNIVYKYYKQLLHEFYQNGDSFKAEAVSVMGFGAYLRYKDTVPLILRNRDFSTDFSKVGDVVAEGRKLEVKVLGYGVVSDDSILVEMKNKYRVDKPIDYRDYNVGDVLDNYTIRTISPFGAYAGSLDEGMKGRDVMIAIHEGQRQPRVGDRVSIKLKIINPETGSAKGDIVKYHDDILDLSMFDLVD